MEKDYKAIAQHIFTYLGEKNISYLSHCATRLRMNLKDYSKVDMERLKSEAGILQVIDNPDEFQIVIGPNVDEVYEELKRLVDQDGVNAGKEEFDQMIAEEASIVEKGEMGEVALTPKDPSKQKTSPLNQAIAVLSAIFTPYISVLAGIGVIKGILVSLQAFDLVSKESFVFIVFNSLSSGIFVFLPMFIAVTAAEKFKSNKYIALALTAAMVFPLTDATTPASTLVFGISFPLKIYGGAVIPALLSVYFLSYVEKWLRKIVPQIAALVFVPFFALIITGFVTFTFIGPVANYVGIGIANSYTWLYDLSPMLSGALLAGVAQLFVIMGVHWGIIPLALINIQINGYDTIMAMFMSSVMGQFGGVFGGIFIAKNKEDRELAISASLSAFFGITEPALYGINLRYKFPFIFGCIGAALGGGVTGFFRVKAYSFLPVLNVFELGVFSGPESQVIYEVLAIVVSFGFAAIATILYGTIRKDSIVPVA